MTHTRKRVFSILLALITVLLCTAPALALPEPTEDFYVADFAEVLTPALEEEIISSNDLLYEQTGAQIVVVTVRYLEDGYYADEYAVQLFDEWGVGDFSENNGLLLLLVTEEAKAWVTQGSGIKHALSNDDISELLEDNFWKKFDDGDFNGAVEKLFGELIEWYENYYDFSLGDGSTVDIYDSVTPAPSTDAFGSRVVKFLFKVIIILIILLAISAIGKASARGSSRSRRSYTYTPPRSTYRPIHVWRPTVHRPSSTRNSSFNSRPSSSRPSRPSSFSSGRSSGGFRSSGGRTGGGGRSGGGGAGRR